MPGNARHIERVRPDAHASASAPVASPTAPGLQRRLDRKPSSRSDLTWVVTASACLTALAVKVSQIWFSPSGDAAGQHILSVAFDWITLILCILALALLSGKKIPKSPPRQSPDTAPPDKPGFPATLPSNLALPAPDDARVRLAHSLGHELRTPLNAVIGFSELMNHQLHGNLGHPKYNEYCAHISASGQSLLRAVDDVLALNMATAIDIRNRVPVKVAQVLETAWEEQTTALALEEKDLPDLTIVDEQEHPVIVDPEILSHAIKNIVGTLIRELRLGTAVSVTIKNVDNKTRIHQSIKIDQSRTPETAPLVASLQCGQERKPDSRNTLSEAAAQALVRSMGGRLTIKQSKCANRLDVICDLPASQQGAQGKTGRAGN